MSGDHNQYQKDKSYLDGMDRYKQVRELVKDPSLRVTEIAWKTGYNKGHVSRLRKEFMRQELCRGEIMSENKNAKTPADDGQPVAWMMVNKVIGPPSLHWKPQEDWHITWECKPLYTAPPKKQWVGLKDEQVEDEWERITGHSIFGGARSEGRAMFISMDEVIEFSRAIEAKLKERNHG